MKRHFVLAASWAVGGTLVAFGQGAAHADGGEEAQKQAARLISQAVTARVSDAVTFRDVVNNPKIKGFWGSIGYTPIDLGSSVNGSIDLIQGIAGSDLGGAKNYVLGVVLTVGSLDGHFDIPTPGLGTGSSSIDFSGSSVGIGPYGALIVNDNFFIAGQLLANVSSEETSGSVAGTSLDSSATNVAVSAEVSANGIYKLGNLNLRGKAGLSVFESIPESGSNITSTALGGTAEAEYMFTKQFGAYTSAEVSYPLSTSGSSSSTKFTPVYVGIGLEFHPSEKSQYGIGYQTQANTDSAQPKTDTFQIFGRMKF